MAKEKILVVDDEAEMRRFIKKTLDAENMLVTLASGGNEAIQAAQSSAFDLIVLDVILDDMDGFEVVKSLRNSGVDIPIFLISGKDEEDYHKILGLGLGADDYITKPFSPAVLGAKVKAQIRRNKTRVTGKNDIITAGPFKLDCSTYKLYKDNLEIHLSSKEIMLFKFFMTNPNQVFTKEQLYQRVWGDIIVDDQTIMVYIWHLRNKLEDEPQNPIYIKTVWGIGYTFSPDST
jgi:DNA-binding response OmpR family regulator